MRTPTTCLVVMALASYAAADNRGQPLVGSLLDAVDRPMGLVHLPRCSDPAQLVALADSGPWVQVHGQAQDGATVNRLRHAVDERGLLNRRISIDQGDLSCLLPVARSCDVVLLTDLQDQELSQTLASEIRRVLHPWYGVAILGSAAGELDAGRLLAWAKSIHQDVTILEREGTLVVVHARPLDNSDDWTHWWHGPDNNAVSRDQAYGLPETLQWSGKPYFSTRIELPIIAGGRLFMLWNGHAMDRSPGPPRLAGFESGESTDRESEDGGPLLTALAVGSGVRLWTQRLSPAAWLQASRSTMVADGGQLLVADGGTLRILDQATGEQLQFLQPGCEEIRWLAVAGRQVLVLGGPATTNYGQRSMDAVVPFRSGGLKILALHRHSLAQQWRVERKPGPDAFDPRSAAVAEDRLFLCTESGMAEAFALRDGAPVWRSQTGLKRWQPQAYEWDRSSRHPVTGYAIQGVYVVSGTEQDRAVALAQDDGRVLWSQDTPKHHQLMPLGWNDLLWDGAKGRDPRSGEPLANLGRIDSGGCSRLTACPSGLIGTSGLTWNQPAGREQRTLSAKSACGAGQLVANGLIWKFPSPCSNCTEWRGFLVRGRCEPARPAPPTLANLAIADKLSAADPDGWLSYRGGADRSCSTKATIPGNPTVTWTSPPRHANGLGSQPQTVLFDEELPPTPPVIAGQTVISAGSDGVIEALDLGSGRCLWRAFTGGRIYSSPTICRNRVLVGSADGHVYAFALTDGRERWRRRIAPQVGKTMIYGQFASRWPVLGSPLILGNRVYAIAGLLDAIDGVWAAGFDAVTGDLLWQRKDWTDAHVEGILSGAGQLAAAGRRVLYQGGEAPVVCLESETGVCAPGFVMPGEQEMQRLGSWGVQAACRTSKGQDIGTLNPGWAVVGGRRLLTDQAELGTWRLALSFLPLESGTEPQAQMIQAEDATLMPAWDETDVLFRIESRRLQVITLIPQAELASLLQQELARPQAKEGVRFDLPGFLHRMKLGEDCRPSWTHSLPYGSASVGSIVTADLALVLEQPRSGTGKLLALARRDGSTAWARELPGVPIHDGLAIASDGSIVVALRDGRLVCIGQPTPSPTH